VNGVPFHKLEGCGNDYVYLDLGLGEAALEEDWFEDPSILSREISDRHTGVGSDGLILLDDATGDGIRMRMWNADGSRGRLCLNGLRGAALLARNLRPELGEAFVIRTDVGPREVLVEGSEHLATVTVAAGEPDFGRQALPATGAGEEFWEIPFDTTLGTLTGYGVSVGNPHLVLWMDSGDAVRNAPLPELGIPIQEGDGFPQGINVHLVAEDGGGGFLTRHWERGSGATRACGTGAVAAFAVARRLGRAGVSGRIHMPGGTVEVREGETGLELIGPAHLTFRGTWYPSGDS
jgi:diaminopimelate epimerase